MNPPVILVIADNSNTREHTRLALASAAVEVVHAGSATEALSVAAWLAPDLILMELFMTAMDGHELIACLRALPGIDRVPIVAIAGFLSRREHARVIEVGFCDLLAKPVDAARLVELVHAHLPVRSTATSSCTGRILIVDDDAIQLKSSALHLRSEGFDVVTARDGVDALEVLHRDAIDAVLSDVLMPRLDGFRLCAAIRQDATLARLPVVLASSSYVDAADRMVAEHMGASGFVVRSPDLGVAIAELRSVLSVERAHSPKPLVERSLLHLRIANQLEQQLARNTVLARGQASIVTVVAAMSAALVRRDSTDRWLPVVLSGLLDASGLAHGALFGFDNGELTALAISGFDPPAIDALCASDNHRVVFDRVIASRMPCALDRELDARALLADTGLRSVIAIPVVSGDSCVGLLLFGSQTRDLGDPDWMAFAQMLSVQIGQALALGRAFGMVISSEARYRAMFERTGECIVADGECQTDDQKRVETSLRRSDEKLRQTQKMEAMGVFASGIAHDFNNVLSVVLSYADLILETLGPDEPMREDVEAISRAGKSATALTRQLLMFSRVQTVVPVALDLNKLLRELERLLEHIAGVEVVVATSLVDNIDLVRIDRGSVEQLIMNLVINARDAMPTGGTLTIETACVVFDEIDVHMHVGTSPGAYVTLSVTDTGTGMDRSTQTRIFEPFFTTKAPGQGTGLGLATVFGIVAHGGGFVDVISELGHGTTFKICLPRIEGEHDEHTFQQPTPFLAARGTETILLVEDTEEVRSVAAAILRRQGYVVIEARNAGEAILAVESATSIDLLLSDVVMPRMSGPDLARRIARSRPETKILFMSGSPTERDDDGLAHLLKPFTPEILSASVREVLDGKR